MSYVSKENVTPVGIQKSPFTKDLDVRKTSTKPTRQGDPKAITTMLTFIHPKSDSLQIITSTIFGASHEIPCTCNLHRTTISFTKVCLDLYYDKNTS